MSEQRPNVRRASKARSAEDTNAAPLQTERGKTNIQDKVVQKIAGIAAQEVQGVRTGGSTSQSVGGILGSIPGVGGGSGESRGISVEVGEVETAVDLTLTVAYGSSIPQVSDAVRRNVVNRVENLVGLRVTEVNVTVNDVFFPEQERQQQQQKQQQQIEQQQEEPRVR